MSDRGLLLDPPGTVQHAPQRIAEAATRFARYGLGNCASLRSDLPRRSEKARQPLCNRQKVRLAGTVHALELRNDRVDFINPVRPRTAAIQHIPDYAPGIASDSVNCRH